MTEHVKIETIDDCGGIVELGFEVERSNVPHPVLRVTTVVQIVDDEIPEECIRRIAGDIAVRPIRSLGDAHNAINRLHHRLLFEARFEPEEHSSAFYSIALSHLEIARSQIRLAIQFNHK